MRRTPDETEEEEEDMGAASETNTQAEEEDTGANEGVPEDTAARPETGHRYNMRARDRPRTGRRLIESMDDPHGSTSYEAPETIFGRTLFQLEDRWRHTLVQTSAKPETSIASQQNAQESTKFESYLQTQHDHAVIADKKERAQGELDEIKERAKHAIETVENEERAEYHRATEGNEEQKAYSDMSVRETRDYVYSFILTQMSANAGIKKHGREAEEALMAEFAQLHDLSVFEGLDPTTLTKAQRREALRAINLIKEKGCGKLKGRTVTDGRPQRTLYEKSETASPTVSTDSLMLSILIDVHEKRDVATADVAGAYLKADMDDFVIMKFTGKSVDIMCEMNPAYELLVTTEGGKRVLYVRLLKALYGCVESALLWYKLFTEKLQDYGFVLNPYDPCAANCDINGKQCTIVWYVDDNKISHVDPKVVSDVIEYIESKFGKWPLNTRMREQRKLA
jgi:hypothetical protein